MKRYWLIILALVLVAPILVYAEQGVTTAIGPSPSYGHTTCTNVATLIRAATPGRTSISFQNQSPTTVYIGPSSAVTTANAPFLLTQYSGFTADRTTGDVAWYCIRAATDNATVGWMEEKK